MQYDAKTLFLVCALCDGRRVFSPVGHGVKCIACDGLGFVSSGLTTSQFDLYKQRADIAEEKLAMHDICPSCDHVGLEHGQAGRGDKDVIASCPNCRKVMVIA